MVSLKGLKREDAESPETAEANGSVACFLALVGEELVLFLFFLILTGCFFFPSAGIVVLGGAETGVVAGGVAGRRFMSIIRC